MMDKDLMAEWIEKIHANAIKHGWWNGKRPIGELISLAHSEVSEALEAYRDNEGDARIAEELADIKIRLLDTVGGLDAGNVDMAHKVRSTNLPCRLAIIHAVIDYAFQIREDADTVRLALLMATEHIDTIGEDFGLDVNSAMASKHEVNLTRKYKHGGKRC